MQKMYQINTQANKTLNYEKLINMFIWKNIDLFIHFGSCINKMALIGQLLTQNYQLKSTHCILKSLYLYNVVSINRSKKRKKHFVNLQSRVGSTNERVLLA